MQRTFFFAMAGFLFVTQSSTDRSVAQEHLVLCRHCPSGGYGHRSILIGLVISFELLHLFLLILGLRLSLQLLQAVIFGAIITKMKDELSHIFNVMKH